ncbi:MAG: hypothetical protein RLZZ435_618, partial [Cyanobacteriota bacterium]
MQVLPEVLSPFIGEVAALTAAGLWALASVIYGWLGQQISALALNVLKGCAAIAMLLLTIAGVAWVLSERTASLSYAFNPDLLKQGLAWAFVAEICQA